MFIVCVQCWLKLKILAICENESSLCIFNITNLIKINVMNMQMFFINGTSIVSFILFSQYDFSSSSYTNSKPLFWTPWPICCPQRFCNSHLLLTNKFLLTTNSFSILMASFQEHPIYEIKTNHINRILTHTQT